MGASSQQLCSVLTATLVGVEAKPVTVEVSYSHGLPGISVVGMPDVAINEARMRVRAALRACGFDVPNVNFLVNLAPSDIPKSGSGLDLPIALGILLVTGQIGFEVVADQLCIGELSLDGSVRVVRGMLAYERLAQELDTGVLSGMVEQGMLKGSQRRHRCLERLDDLLTDSYTEPFPRNTALAQVKSDYADIAGNDLAKRALTIAATGEHGLMMVGPPGSGKTMMASRLPTIMPPLSEQERCESAMIHSVAGLPYERILEGERSFRAPHHTATRAGLVGGGTPVMPGEVSLAHNGILFLDEIPEFGSAALQLLRQPIENGFVSLARARGTTTLPSSFMLVAAANPCPCGFYGDPEQACTCSESEIRRYQGRIGGPLLDRLDLVLDIWRSKPGEVLATGSGTSSAQMRAEVLQARAFAQQRIEAAHNKELLGYDETDSVKTAHTQTEDHPFYTSEGMRLLAACNLGRAERACFEEAAEQLTLSGRGIMRALSVSRTIADLEQSERVLSSHLLEALSFRADGRYGDGRN